MELFIVEVIKTTGFPIFIACWLLIRTEKKLDKLCDHIKNLMTTILKDKKE